MKKLVVILLVLSVASFAQASLFLTINGQNVTAATVTVGQTLTVGINSTDLSVVPDPTAYTGYGMYSEMSLVAVPADWSAGWAKLTNPVASAATGPGAIAWQSAAPYEHMSASGWDHANPVPAAAGLWFEWTYTALLPGECYINLLTWAEGYATTDYWDQVTVTQVPVPEPTTMTLLGLGLVALFRKK